MVAVAVMYGLPSGSFERIVFGGVVWFLLLTHGEGEGRELVQRHAVSQPEAPRLAQACAFGNFGGLSADDSAGREGRPKISRLWGVRQQVEPVSTQLTPVAPRLQDNLEDMEEAEGKDENGEKDGNEYEEEKEEEMEEEDEEEGLGDQQDSGNGDGREKSPNLEQRWTMLLRKIIAQQQVRASSLQVKVGSSPVTAEPQPHLSGSQSQGSFSQPAITRPKNRMQRRKSPSLPSHGCDLLAQHPTIAAAEKARAHRLSDERLAHIRREMTARRHRKSEREAAELNVPRPVETPGADEPMTDREDLVDWAYRHANAFRGLEGVESKAVFRAQPPATRDLGLMRLYMSEWREDGGDAVESTRKGQTARWRGWRAEMEDMVKSSKSEGEGRRERMEIECEIEGGRMQSGPRSGMGMRLTFPMEGDEREGGEDEREGGGRREGGG